MAEIANFAKISHCLRLSAVALTALFLFAGALASASSAYVRVSQVGYETGDLPFQPYLMSTVSDSGATFSVIITN